MESNQPEQQQQQHRHQQASRSSKYHLPLCCNPA
jgi:hypothetical protein